MYQQNRNHNVRPNARTRKQYGVMKLITGEDSVGLLTGLRVYPEKKILAKGGGIMEEPLKLPMGGAIKDTRGSFECTHFSRPRIKKWPEIVDRSIFLRNIHCISIFVGYNIAKNSPPYTHTSIVCVQENTALLYRNMNVHITQVNQQKMPSTLL